MQGRVLAPNGNILNEQNPFKRTIKREGEQLSYFCETLPGVIVYSPPRAQLLRSPQG